MSNFKKFLTLLPVILALILLIGWNVMSHKGKYGDGSVKISYESGEDVTEEVISDLAEDEEELVGYVDEENDVYYPNGLPTEEETIEEEYYDDEEVVDDSSAQYIQLADGSIVPINGAEVTTEATTETTTEETVVESIPLSEDNYTDVISSLLLGNSNYFDSYTTDVFKSTYAPIDITGLSGERVDMENSSLAEGRCVVSFDKIDSEPIVVTVTFTINEAGVLDTWLVTQ